MARCAVGGHRRRRRRARALPARATDRPRAPGRHRRAVLGQHGLRQHDPDRPGRAHARQHRDRGAPARLHALERDGDGRQGESPAPGRRRRPRRPHLQLRVGGARCSAPASTTSGTPRARATAATCSTSRATRRPASTRAPSWKAGSARSSCSNFRQEVDGKGISSYPHPKLMPEFWQFPTVSMGLGPLMAIYQARFLKYLHARGIADTANRKVWVFCGDGEMDEPESLRRDRPGGAREARQPDLRHQLQPAAPGRPGARQRQDHPGARGRVPRLGLERHQAALGQLLGSAAGARQGRHAAQGDDGHRRRRLPGVQGQRRRLRAQELLRPPPEAAGDGRQDERRGHLAPEPRRPRPAEGLRGVPSRGQPRGPADACC